MQLAGYKLMTSAKTSSWIVFTQKVMPTGITMELTFKIAKMYVSLIALSILLMMEFVSNLSTKIIYARIFIFQIVRLDQVQAR